MSKGQKARSILRASWNLLLQDKELMWLPLIALGAQILVLLTFAVPTFLSGIGRNGNPTGPTGIIVMFSFYFVASFVTIFFNAAIICGVNQRIAGQDPTLRSALDGAWERRGRLAMWALVSATISTIMRMVEERLGLMGRLIALLIVLPAAIAWSVMVFLVVPILVIEDVPVRTAIKRSTELFKAAWGERIRAGFTLSVAFLAAVLALGILAVLSIFLGPAAFVVIPLCILGMFALGMLSQTLTAVYQTVMYHYAAEGTVPEGWDAQVLQGAYIPKKR